MTSLPRPTEPRNSRRQLPRQQFLEVVERAPLVSIDLIARDAAGQVLLGLRRNAPAQGWWFVPGGCIRKDETLDDAFAHIVQAELGLAAQRADARFLGVYEHFYPDNAGGASFGTHYVVLGYALEPASIVTPPPEQHSEYRWLAVDALLNDPRVHDHTKAYFR